MNIPNIPHQSTPLLSDGNMHPNWYLYFSQLTDQLQQNVSQEGTGIPKQSTANISRIEAANPTPRIIYDSDLDLGKIAINGVFKTIATL